MPRGFGSSGLGISLIGKLEDQIFKTIRNFIGILRRHANERKPDRRAFSIMSVDRLDFLLRSSFIEIPILQVLCEVQSATPSIQGWIHGFYRDNV